MTSLPANTFHFRERGLLKPGFWADLALFDPATVRDTAVFNDPHHYPEGFSFVIVNGLVVLDQGKHTGAKAGRPLRRED
jgi:N-acyl-D-amino-acid deacylase